MKYRYLLLLAPAAALASCSMFTGQDGDPFVDTLQGLYKGGKIDLETLQTVLSAYRDLLTQTSQQWWETALEIAGAIAGSLFGVRVWRGSVNNRTGSAPAGTATGGPPSPRPGE